MKTLCIVTLLFLPLSLTAQRGDIVIAVGSSISVPSGAQICADRIFANNTGFGTLHLANKTCLCSGAVIIPVELLTFSASLDHGNVLLTWVTATETLNYGFEIHRQIDNSDWQTVGFIPGHGTTVQLHVYVFNNTLTDLPSDCRILRYRLGQIDLDGHCSLSSTVELRLSEALPDILLRCYPSPCDEWITIVYSHQHAEQIRIKLTDMAGRTFHSWYDGQFLPGSSQTLLFSTADLPTGQYLLLMDAGVERTCEKLLVQH